MAYAIDRETLIDEVVRGLCDAGHDADRAPLRATGIGSRRRGADRVRPGRGGTDLGRGRLPRHRRRRRCGSSLRAVTRSSLRLFTESTDVEGIKAAPYIQGWFRDVGIECRDQDDDRQQALRRLAGVARLGPDHLLLGRRAPTPTSCCRRFTTGQCWILERHLLQQPRVRRALQGAAERRSTEPNARRWSTRCSRSCTPTRPRSCCGTPTPSRRGASDRWTGFVRLPEPDGDGVLGEHVLRAGLVRPISATPRCARTSRADRPAGCGCVLVVAVAAGSWQRTRDDGDSTGTTRSEEGARVGGWRYVGRKVLQAFFTLIFVLVFNFFLFRIMPGDPVRLLTRQRGIELSVEAQESLRRDLGSRQAAAGAVRRLRR